MNEYEQEAAYLAWCQTNSLDPDDTDSMAAYEAADYPVPDEPPEDHRC